MGKIGKYKPKMYGEIPDPEKTGKTNFPDLTETRFEISMVQRSEIR